MNSVTALPDAPDKTAQDQKLQEGGHVDRSKLIDMRLLIGDSLQLDCGMPLKSQKTYVKLVGYLKDRSIIVTTPSIGGRRLELVENDNVLIRGFSGTNAYAFRASVTRVSRLPFDHVYLSFPDAVFGRSVRRSQRVRTELEAHLHSSSPTRAEPVSGRVEDLGALGALISTEHELDPESPLRLSTVLMLHGNRVELEAESTIVSHYTETTDAATLHCYGLKFSNLEPQDAMLLKAYVYQQIVDNPDSVR
jgi:c-di-GMP-binding flagellar brake protein YcgR